MKELYIHSLELQRDKIVNHQEFPFSLEVIKSLKRLKFDTKVTFLIGENGVGKSTLLEAIAINYGFNPEGGSKNFVFSTNDSHSDLHRYVRLAKGVKMPKDNFFLRGDNIFNLSTEVDRLNSDGKLSESYGGKSLHHKSHGESFLSVFMNRLRGNGLYLVDEPETALSLTSQMALLAKMHDLVQKNSQFIICTHSPIILSYPSATIYHVSELGIRKTNYEETDICNLYRTFILGKEKMLAQILRPTS